MSPWCFPWNGFTSADCARPAGPPAHKRGHRHDTPANADRASRAAEGCDRYTDRPGSLWATTLIIRQVTLSLESLSKAMSLSIMAAC